MSWYECPKCGRELTSEQAYDGRCKRCGDVCVRVRGQNPDGPVNLNKATFLELQRIAGFGAKTANCIIWYRERHRFAEVRQFLSVRGVGKKTFEAVKEKVFV